ncbi:hypothetical protein M0R45_028477 [Rubus argutus]|uniref:Uncharacterized protein n=1 Tax=Rubus argutus TaxID=59490 RepID=A0AAW1W7T2_RUBAR
MVFYFLGNLGKDALIYFVFFYDDDEELKMVWFLKSEEQIQRNPLTVLFSSPTTQPSSYLPSQIQSSMASDCCCSSPSGHHLPMLFHYSNNKGHHTSHGNHKFTIPAPPSPRFQSTQSEFGHLQSINTITTNTHINHVMLRNGTPNQPPPSLILSSGTDPLRRPPYRPPATLINADLRCEIGANLFSSISGVNLAQSSLLLTKPLFTLPSIQRSVDELIFKDFYEMI